MASGANRRKKRYFAPTLPEARQKPCREHSVANLGLDWFLSECRTESHISFFRTNC